MKLLNQYFNCEDHINKINYVYNFILYNLYIVILLYLINQFIWCDRFIP